MNQQPQGELVPGWVARLINARVGWEFVPGELSEKVCKEIESFYEAEKAQAVREFAEKVKAHLAPHTDNDEEWKNAKRLEWELLEERISVGYDLTRATVDRLLTQTLGGTE